MCELADTHGLQFKGKDIENHVHYQNTKYLRGKAKGLRKESQIAEKSMR